VKVKDCRIFADLTSEEFAEVEKNLKKRIMKPGEAVFFEGEAGDRFYIISKGTISICTDIEGVGVEELVSMKAGAFFGEMALIDNGPRSASAVARGETELVYLEKDSFLDLMESKIVVANKILRNMVLVFCERLRDSNERIHDYYRMNRTFHGVA